jgi:predicted HTH domain antitoxin
MALAADGQTTHTWTAVAGAHIQSSPQLTGGPNMPTITLDLPTDVFSSLRRSPDEFTRELRLAAAIYWYSHGELSQEKAAAVAGLDRVDFLLALSRRSVDAFEVDMPDLRRELARG